MKSGASNKKIFLIALIGVGFGLAFGEIFPTPRPAAQTLTTKLASKTSGNSHVRELIDQYKRGKYYYKSQTEPLADKDAVGVLNKYASQGDAAAEYNLGDLYFNGKGTSVDRVEAVKWYRKAAEQGLPIAENATGEAYQYGIGVDQDYKEAFAWYSKAANQNFPWAQHHLALLYKDGLGIQRDYSKAFEWSKKAAMQNFSDAQIMLGFLYSQGNGVLKSYGEAYYWLLLATPSVDPSIKDKLLEVAGNLTTDEKSAIEQRVKTDRATTFAHRPTVTTPLSSF